MGEKLRRIWAFVRKDLYESIKNRSILIAVVLPIAASLLFGVLDNVQAPKNFSLAMYEETGSEFTQFVIDTAINFEVEAVSTIERGLELVETGDVDGFIQVQSEDEFLVFLDSGRPVYFFALSEQIKQLIDIYLGVPIRYDLEIIAVGDTTVSRSVLPVWITVTMSMIGVMVVSGMFAEEKDTKTLEAIGVSPAGYGELLLGKGVFGVLLSLGTVVIMLLLNRVLGLNYSGWIALGALALLGGACFTAIGLLIGVLASGQSTARSVATIVYFPLLFPTLISDLSAFTRRLAGFFPTFHVFTGLEAVLLRGQGVMGVWSELLVLLAFSIILLFATLIAYRRMVNSHD
ncbi:MAG TPA: ABC transporter permease [Limnochordia bacterium]|nr:ABC transporter permease [Limnochordia bacterium]